jgi:hypothetical protein
VNPTSSRLPLVAIANAIAIIIVDPSVDRDVVIEETMTLPPLLLPLRPRPRHPVQALKMKLQADQIATRMIFEKPSVISNTTHLGDPTLALIFSTYRHPAVKPSKYSRSSLAFRALPSGTFETVPKFPLHQRVNGARLLTMSPLTLTTSYRHSGHLGHHRVRRKATTGAPSLPNQLLTNMSRLTHNGTRRFANIPNVLSMSCLTAHESSRITQTSSTTCSPHTLRKSIGASSRWTRLSDKNCPIVETSTYQTSVISRPRLRHGSAQAVPARTSRLWHASTTLMPLLRLPLLRLRTTHLLQLPALETASATSIAYVVDSIPALARTAIDAFIVMYAFCASSLDIHALNPINALPISETDQTANHNAQGSLFPVFLCVLPFALVLPPPDDDEDYPRLLLTNPRSRQAHRQRWSLDRLIHERNVALGSALSQGSYKAYNSQLQLYLTFCKLHHTTITPSPDSLSLFIP